MIEQHPISVYAPKLSNTANPAAGYFAAIRLDDFSAESLAATTVYSRKDFYKVSLINGNATYHTRDAKYLVKAGEWALIFTNRASVYRWETTNETCRGYSCMFTEDFLPLHTYHRPSDWAVFNGEAQSVFRLSGEEKVVFLSLFEKMIAEQASNYANKYELLFLYVLECIHAAMKLQPEPEYRQHNAGTRLIDAFKNLLAGQYPLVSPHQQLTLRKPQEFADRLAVHPNHLNRVLKDMTGMTTTAHVTERMMQEAMALLKHSNWSITQIAACLGFVEPTHFARAFKAHYGQTPTSIR